MKGAVLLALGVLTLGCGDPHAIPIVWGEDTCEVCHMPIADPRYAAELVTATGKVYRFDDVGCLADFVRTDQVPKEQIHSLWAMDFLAPDSLYRLDGLVFLLSDQLHTPMNHGVVALRSGPAADSLLVALEGRWATWPDVLSSVASSRGTR